MLCVMVLGIRAYLQRYMYVCMFSYSRVWSLDSCEEDGQTMHQCLTAPLEITSFGWNTPQIPSGSLVYSQTRVTITPEPLSLGWSSEPCLPCLAASQYIKLMQSPRYKIHLGPILIISSNSDFLHHIISYMDLFAEKCSTKCLMSAITKLILFI